MQEVIKIFKNKSILKSITLCVFITISIAMDAQTDKKFIRQGNREYEKSKFSDSEISYRKAVDKNKQSPDALFNVGDALYKQNKFEEAGKQFTENVSENYDKSKKSAGLYNLGNSLLKAYKLSYAQDLLKLQQQKQKQQQDKQDQNKDKKKDEQKKDQKDQNDKNKDQQKDQNDKKDQKQQQKPQPQQQDISKEDAERLLNSLANDEKNVEEKVKLAKAAKTKVRTVKNW